MPIAGIVILTDPAKADKVLYELKQIPNVTTYGVHKENNIIAVLDTETGPELKEVTNRLQHEIDGIIGVYPSCVNYEDLES